MKLVSKGLGVKTAISLAKCAKWEYVRVSMKSQTKGIIHEEVNRFKDIDWDEFIQVNEGKKITTNSNDVVIGKTNEIEVFFDSCLFSASPERYEVTIIPLSRAEKMALEGNDEDKQANVVFVKKNQDLFCNSADLEKRLELLNRTRSICNDKSLSMQQLLNELSAYLYSYSISYVKKGIKNKQTIYYTNNLDLILFYLDKIRNYIAFPKGIIKIKKNEWVHWKRLVEIVGNVEMVLVEHYIEKELFFYIDETKKIKVSFGELDNKTLLYLLTKFKEKYDPSSLLVSEVMTCSEADEHWSLPKGTVKRDCNRDRFNPTKIRKSGNTWLIAKEELKHIYGFNDTHRSNHER